MSLTRREFLKTAGAMGAVASLGDLLLQGPVSTLLTSQKVEQGAPEGEWLPTTCWIGKQDCGVLARRVEGRIVKLEGHPSHPRNLGKLCPKGVAQIMQLYDPYRVKAPLVRTNPKGEPGVWKEVSWDEALSTVAAALNEVRAKDKRLFIWQKGRSKSEPFYDNAFNKAFGTVNKQSHGATCSDAVYRAMELTFSNHGATTADFRYCDYLISWGFNFTEAGGPHLCYITWPRQILDARERGMKIVHIDPRIRGGAHFVDEWLPIRPGTDMALALAMANVLLERGYVDREYLQNFTNAPFLVNSEPGSRDHALFYRVEGKEQVWDETSASAKPHEEKGVKPALEGSFRIEGTAYKPVFQLFKEHVAQYTPEWAEKACGVQASTIRRIAEEFGGSARIASRITLDGVELPYRPVAIATYHASQQELGTQAWRAIAILSVLVGAVDVVGSTYLWDRKLDYPSFQGKWEAMAKDPAKVKDVPDKLSLDGSKFYPIASGGYTQAPVTMIDAGKGGPGRYGLPYKTEDMMMMLHMVNPVITAPNQGKVLEGYRKLKFVVAIDPWVSETADLFADIVLPAATMEKYEGPLGVRTQYVKADTLRMPVVDPLFKSKPDAEIYIDLCEKMGILYGKDGYIDQLNKELKLPADLALPLDRKPALEDIFDRWARSKGKDLAWFKKNSVIVSDIPAKEVYMRAWSPPYGGVKAHIYSEILLRLGRIMKDKGVDAIYYQDYAAFPTWRKQTMDNTSADYDLYLISFKKIEHKQSRTAFNALLNEIEPDNHLLINAQTAEAKGIGDGEAVWVESHNGRTGERLRVRATTRLMQGIRPDTVAISHHHGHWAHPVARGKGVTANVIYPSGEGYIDMTGNQSFVVKVRVYK